jgi:hypothetical protein
VVLKFFGGMDEVGKAPTSSATWSESRGVVTRGVCRWTEELPVTVTFGRRPSVRPAAIFGQEQASVHAQEREGLE